MLVCCLIALDIIASNLMCLTPTDATKELVSNGDFTSKGTDNLPTDWSVWNPVVKNASCSFKASSEGVLVEAPNNPYSVGGIFQEIKGIEGRCAYAFKVDCALKNIQFPYRAVFVRATWLRDGAPLHYAGMLIRGPIIGSDLAKFDDVLTAPNEANGVVISLDVKWLQGGAVIWKNVSMKKSEPIKPRKVKIGTVYLRPSGGTPEKNLQQCCEQIDDAGKLGLDIVCLGEALTMAGTPLSVVDCAQPIPGRDTEILGDAARRNKIWVVAGLTELDGDTLYNTAVLLDREGKVAGKYRKIHLPREEWKQGITPGSEYPVFQTDFGTVAIQICYDWFFSEPESIFALKGAEIIFAPTWGNTLPDHDGIADGETVFRVRARDNGVYMVPSVYDGNSLVIDPMGRILASNNGKNGVFWAEVDLNKREELDWVGYWRSIGPRHRMVETYLPLLEYPEKPTY
jgi:predicted amidohydrolase